MTTEHARVAARAAIGLTVEEMAAHFDAFAVESPLEQVKAEHTRYHETGMCYGDSHADFLARIATLQRSRSSFGLCPDDDAE